MLFLGIPTLSADPHPFEQTLAKRNIANLHSMKKNFWLLTMLTFVALSGFSQSFDDRPLNPAELREKGWFYDLDSALATPENVYKLSLTGQDLKSLPPEIGTLKNVQILNLSENKLKNLPDEIFELKKVQMISLYKNKLRYIPNEFKDLRRLEALYLGANKIIEIPLWMGGMSRLRRLDVSRNPISPQELIYIRRMMPRCDVTY